MFVKCSIVWYMFIPKLYHNQSKCAQFNYGHETYY